jgi:phosphoglycerol transferase
VPGQTLPLAWLIAYASVGGLTNLLALFVGFQVFRATNRAAIFISAIVLFFLVTRLSRQSLRWPAWQRLGVAAILAVVGVFEQLPKPEPPDYLAQLAADVKSDEAFGAALEKKLPAGAMVFQLPVVGFPEAPAPNQLGEYDHFRPYLATQHLEFSYGAAKQRSRSRWQRELAALPVEELVHHLERHGFAALYLNRKGFADRGETLLRQLGACGYVPLLESSRGDQVVVQLRGAAESEPPLARSFTYGLGWHTTADQGWRWAYGEAALSYFNPYSHPITVDLQLNVTAVTSRAVVLEHEGKPVQRFTASEAPQPTICRHVQLTPGVNRFTLSSSARPVRRHAGQNQLRSFAVEEASVCVSVKPMLPSKPAFAGLGP